MGKLMLAMPAFSAHQSNLNHYPFVIYEKER